MLEATAAEAFGAGELAVAALPGTEMGLRLLELAGLPQPFRYLAPGYRTHADALPSAAAIHADAAEDVRDGTLLLANPNNPDGRVFAPDRLLGLGRRLAQRGGMLVIDEAFADATPRLSILPHLRREDRVLVFRSFGKFFGLAGVRLGFACGAADIVAALRKRLGSWPVSATAIAIGTAAYRDTAWTTRTRLALAERCAALDALLRRHALEPRGASPLFRLVETPQARAIFTYLAQRGILTRPFDYAPEWLRIGVPADTGALQRLDQALSDR
uniref:aminotransferase class I/II-fold pyridoxal phosphate-dependent enzyme n=1 Tax=Sphingomonas sp. PL-96 TaxID=2887201 RepID=UPI002B4BF671|nr:aminotransferase class I/II-fold pyridoxal phosphate-dependent enzyme [Sphingomonas sp. PL-96]